MRVHNVSSVGYQRAMAMMLKHSNTPSLLHTLSPNANAPPESKGLPGHNLESKLESKPKIARSWAMERELKSRLKGS